jgi:hypothetical protein
MGGFSRLGNFIRLIKGEEKINGGDETLRDKLSRPIMKSISQRLNLETNYEGKCLGRSF